VTVKRIVVYFSRQTLIKGRVVVWARGFEFYKTEDGITPIRGTRADAHCIVLEVT
jgi:hypothetical protein